MGTKYSATCRKIFRDPGKSSEQRTDATRVRKTRQAHKRLGMGKTHRTGPSSCPQLCNVPSVFLRVAPILLVVSQLLPVDVRHLEVVCVSIPPTSVPNLSRQVSKPSKPQKTACQDKKARKRSVKFQPKL